MHESGPGRSCCKSLFALVIKISFGCTRDFRVKMWGTSSPGDKLTGELGNVIEAISIGGRRSDFFTARKVAPGNLGLLKQYRHKAAKASAAVRSWRKRTLGQGPGKRFIGSNCHTPFPEPSISHVLQK